MKPVVFYSINEGLFFWNSRHGLMLDYLFDDLVPAWSDMPDLTRRRMLEHAGEFSREHTLLFTHSHPDHYSKRHVKEYTELYSSGIYGPGIPESNMEPLPIERGAALLELPGYQVIVLKAEHQGRKESLKVDNTLLCVGAEGSWYIHCGDSVLDEDLLARMERCGVHAPEAVFVNYYHIVPKDQRDFLRRLNAKRIFAIHFPFEENDGYEMKHRLTRFLNHASDPFLKEIVVPTPMSRIL